MYLAVLYLASVLNLVYYPLLKNLRMIDEIIVALLVLGWLLSLKKMTREFLFACAVLCFFLGYSIYRHVNVWQAALTDFLLFAKPIACFYIPLMLSYKLSVRDKNLIAFFLFISGIFCIIQVPFLNYIYDNTTTYYQCCMYCGLNYLFFSSRKKTDVLFCFLILSCGLFSFRAKYFTEFIFFVYVFFFLKVRIRLNIKYVICALLISLLVVYVNYQKIKHYLVHDDLVRTKFYYTVPQILVDYFPLGSGFGTFNTEGAARYYSPLYEKYGFSNTWGARQIDYRTGSDFLKDTFYPALSQFGIAGYLLFFLFWRKRLLLSKNLPFSEYKFFIVFFFIEMIQNIAANAFTGGDGVTLLMFFGILSKNAEKCPCQEYCLIEECKNVKIPRIENVAKTKC